MGDAGAIAAVQARAWRAGYAALLPPRVLAGLDPELLAQTWTEAITSAPSPAHAVLVAVGDGLVVGVASLDGRGEVGTLAIDPPAQRAGHGSRLLAAVAEHARGHAVPVLSTWCPVPDEARRAFLTSAGFVPDGGLRLLSHGDVTVQEAHLVASVQEGS